MEQHLPRHSAQKNEVHSVDSDPLCRSSVLSVLDSYAWNLRCPVHLELRVSRLPHPAYPSEWGSLVLKIPPPSIPTIQYSCKNPGFKDRTVLRSSSHLLLCQTRAISNQREKNSTFDKFQERSRKNHLCSVFFLEELQRVSFRGKQNLPRPSALYASPL